MLEIKPVFQSEIIFCFVFQINFLCRHWVSSLGFLQRCPYKNFSKSYPYSLKYPILQYTVLLTILSKTINISVPLRAEVTLFIWKAICHCPHLRDSRLRLRTSRELWPPWSFYRLILTFAPKTKSPPCSRLASITRSLIQSAGVDVLRDVGCFILLRM